MMNLQELQTVLTNRLPIKIFLINNNGYHSIRITLIISKYLLFVVMSTWSVVAVFFLENGDVVLRGKHSEHFGSLTVYVLGWLVFYFVIVFYELAYQKKAKKINYTIQTRNFSQRTWKILTYISCLAIILVTGCFLSVCTKPYFLLGIDRFAYSQGGYRMRP